MRQGWSLLLGIGVLVGSGLMTACGGGGGASGDPSAANGEKLFRQTCATCHGMNGEGIDKLGKALVGNEFLALNSEKALVDFLVEGRSATHPDNSRGVDMPPRGGNPKLTDEDLAAIIVYARSLR